MGSIWAEFGLDYTKFQQGVQQVTQELVTLDGKYREAAARMEQTVNAAMERLGATISAASSKQSLLGDSFDGNAAKARALEQALDELLMAGVSPTNQRVQELAKELQTVRGRMEEAAKAAEQMARETESVGQRVQALAQQMTQVGSQMSIGLTLPLTALTGFAAKASMDFESAMAKVWTITDMTKSQLDSLGSQLERLSSSIPQSAQQLAAGLYDAIGSGITDVAEAMQVLEVAAKAGQAGATSTAVAMDALTSAINAYGMEASQAGELADVMFRAMDKGKLTFEEIAGNLGQVISTAAVAGVQFEEIAAAFATLTKGGVGAAEAATAVNQAILTIIQPSEQAAAYAEQLGIEFNAAALASKGLSGVLEDVYQATGGNIESMTTLFSNVRALKGALGLTRNEMQDYKSDLDSMATASGAAERAFEKQMQTSAAQAQLFRNEIANLGRAFGAELLPMLNSLIERIKPLVQAFADLPDGAKQAAIVFAAVTAAIGPLMAAVGGLVTLMSGPAGWIVAITAVGAALYGLVSSIRDVDGQMTRMIQSAQDTISKLKDQAQEYGNNARALNDLLVKYEDLAEKSKTSETAQKELQEVVKRIGEIAPGVVTQWNDVGEAIAINSDKAKEAVREMLEARKALLEVAVARAEVEKPHLEQIIRENQSRVDAATKRLDTAQKAARDAETKLAKAEALLAKYEAAKETERAQILKDAVAQGILTSTQTPLLTGVLAARQEATKARKQLDDASEAAKRTSASFYDAHESLAKMKIDAAELAAVLDKLNEGDLWAGLEGKGGKTGKSGAATSGGKAPVPDKTTLTA
ncbi:MAG: phage tail tape measure protein, partial [Armatimonadetes bacterium]|nr:phage tail tape measure protein [Armatimonadota bacterium]